MARPAKVRLDRLLVERGLAPTRSVATGCILAGRVFSGEQRLDKPGLALAVDTPLSVRELPRYVSRGGQKLEGALLDLSVEVTGLTCLDIGASTGGFTDCLLQHGAARVYAVDVGRGQLAHRLTLDARVINREGVNARRLTREDFPDPIDLVVLDASFIGLSKLIGAVAAVLPVRGRLLAMIKPQFEAGPELATRYRGVIKDETLRQQIIGDVIAGVARSGFEVLGSRDSRLAGPKGNLEHFVLAERSSGVVPPSEPPPEATHA